ncbi:hypothetical protein BDW22DRAFT_1354053 [Trametopsis cervina]|nr:hypothetical protein BDW22DRAFT_1354053 [Trametopsis cervina]
MLATSQLTRELEGIHTDVILQVFGDQILVLITQLGKVGSLIQATIPDTAPLLSLESIAELAEFSLPPPPPAIQLTPLLGHAQSEHMQTLHTLYASQAATLVWIAEASGIMAPERRGVIVGVALKRSPEDGRASEYEQKIFHGVMGMLKELLA